jgi:hypothetical protein
MTSGHTKMNRMNLRISLKRQEYCTSWHSKSRNQPRWRSEQLQRGAPLLATVHRRVHLSRSCSCPTSAAKVFTHQTLLVIASCVVSLNKSWQSRSFGSGGRQSQPLISFCSLEEGMYLNTTFYENIYRYIFILMMYKQIHAILTQIFLRWSHCITNDEKQEQPNPRQKGVICKPGEPSEHS